MIPVLLAAISGYLVASNWQEIEDWLRELFMPDFDKFLEKTLKEAGIVDYAAKLFVSDDGKNICFVHRLYYKENGEWVEKTTVRELDKSDVPDWFKAGLTAKETDVTEHYANIFQVKKPVESTISKYDVPDWAKKTAR